MFTVICCLITAVVTAIASGHFTAVSITKDMKLVPLIPGAFYELPGITKPVYLWGINIYNHNEVKYSRLDGKEWHEHLMPKTEFRRLASVHFDLDSKVE